MREESRLIQFRVRFGHCPTYGLSVFCRLAQSEMYIRCVRCRATPVTLSLVKALQSVTASQNKQLAKLHTFELSRRGALACYLQRAAAKVTLCEYFDDV